ncbi:hypothetical protein TVAG_191360 [Trichomonas vaginalis G3]|uniref:Inner centromere protein ARK-binding domain-containing protein n=1 Tax=Trichomonas vaginalis (strain ATCC PRA-98 / G3) TaxID=412133 RepID=A2EQJ2_TRIV3|nr:inner centromere protein, ARK binding region-containing protein [Trichomonas vaginalis G3]EAY05039.1 hypothetical protein TVAG_191360 [Trichomonas vaginalis G3]KAI5488956.1 inner centromere protein, ARK binding region-containing protein [Trichomonas vaginalis G3]|eukprot:XP_001317262.1 hypothetical protein [Trichomonas vaginalis G3]
MNQRSLETNLMSSDSSDLLILDPESRISHDSLLIKPNFHDEKISDKSQDHSLFDEKLYMNITSSHRKRLINSPKTKTHNSSPSKQFNMTKMIESGNDLLKSIIKTLSDSNAYDMSDWADEDAMKDEDFDSDCEEYEGKLIPEWAQKESLKYAVTHQNQSDGDKLFATLPRRCNLETVFGTKSIPYYMKQYVSHK